MPSSFGGPGLGSGAQKVYNPYGDNQGVGAGGGAGGVAGGMSMGSGSIGL